MQIEATTGAGPARCWRMGALALVALAGLSLLTNPAGALQKWEWSKGVTSSSTSFQSVRTCFHPVGTVGIRQTYATGGAAGYYRLQNVRTGNVTSAKATSSGGLVWWDNVAAASHTMQVRRLSPADTNGWGTPGSGVTTFRGRFSCPSA
jgi:hypothetical protein